MPRASTTRDSPSRRDRSDGGRHEHRTAKVVEIVSSSSESFDDAIRNGLRDASQSTRGITGAQVQTMTIKCDDGRIVEYKVALKIAFGVERTPQS